MAVHEIPLERATLHGHFSPDLAPVLEIEPGDTVQFSTLDAGWGLEAPSPESADRRLFEPREPELDEGHALIGPIAVRGSRAGQVLSVRVDELRVGPFGFTFAGGWRSDENVRLGVDGGAQSRARLEARRRRRYRGRPERAVGGSATLPRRHGNAAG